MKVSSLKYSRWRRQAKPVSRQRRVKRYVAVDEPGDRRGCEDEDEHWDDGPLPAECGDEDEAEHVRREHEVCVACCQPRRSDGLSMSNVEFSLMLEFCGRCAYARPVVRFGSRSAGWAVAGEKATGNSESESRRDGKQRLVMKSARLVKSSC